MSNIDCTICGREVNVLTRVEIEGTIVEVCDKCIKFGTKIETMPRYKPIVRKLEFKELKENELGLIANYGKVISRTRQLKGLTRKDFAKRIGEKESVIKRIEEEQMKPAEELIKRIENFLGTKLREKYQEKLELKKEKKRPKLTIGDVVEVS